MKIVRFLLLPTLIFSFSMTLLDAMECEKWDRNNYDNYPCVKRLLLLAGPLCYPLSEKMNDGNDGACFQVLPDELRGYIKTMYILISRESLLQDLIDWGMISQDALDYEEELRAIITQLVVQNEYTFLEVLLNAMRRHKCCMSYSIVAHDQLVAMVSKLVQVKPQDFVEKYFATLPEGTLKMAMRSVYAIKHMQLLDEYDCVIGSCPQCKGSCLMLGSEPSDETGNTCFLRWHIRLSNNPLCTQEMIPIVFVCFSQS